MREVRVRGDAALTLRLLLRGTGLAGLVAAVGGVVALSATRLPWYAARTTVRMLGAEGDRVVATLRGVPDTAWGWAALVAGVAALVLGVGIAFDRPLPAARAGLIAAAAAIVAAAAGALLWPPELARVAGDEVQTLGELARRLPVGVELDLEMARALGPWAALAGATLVCGGVAGARDL